MMGFGAKNDLYDASARVRFALSRKLALTGEYMFYSYRFEQAGALPRGFPSHLERRAFRVGLDVWLPLLH